MGMVTSAGESSCSSLIRPYSLCMLCCRGHCLGAQQVNSSPYGQQFVCRSFSPSRYSGSPEEIASRWLRERMPLPRSPTGIRHTASGRAENPGQRMPTGEQQRNPPETEYFFWQLLEALQTFAWQSNPRCIGWIALEILGVRVMRRELRMRACQTRSS